MKRLTPVALLSFLAIFLRIVIGALSRTVAYLGVITVASIALMALPSRSVAQEPQALTQNLDIGMEGLNFTVRYPSNWSVAPKQFINSWNLINVPADQQVTTMPTARVKILAESRLDHAEAVHQLQELGSGLRISPSKFLEIGGWPALQVSYMDRRSQPSQGPQFKDRFVLRITTSIAAGKLLVHLDASLPSDANQALIDEATGIGRGVVFGTTGNPEQVQEELDKLRSSPLPQRSTPAPPGPETPGSAAESVPLGAQESQAEPPPGFNERVFTQGFGELEIAVSPDGKNIVIGKNVGVWIASNDGGQSFPFSGTINAFDSGDPSLAYALSGSFYYAGIDGGCQPATMAAPFGFTCTGMARSTDNGARFPLVNPAVVCPDPDPNPNDGVSPVAGSCFPDQEHIAADQFNAGTGGGDQVYSTWRNFDAIDQDAGLVCSQDSGQTWTAPFDLMGNSFFPRINVGQDGFVYVAAVGGGNYRIWKFNSCANGLVLQAGFPKNVATQNPVFCPFPGHDRCDQNPSSQTVAVDDTNPNHIYYAFAENTAPGNAGNEDIIVQDSLDGGFTWSASAARRVRVNTAVPAKRIMPWLCTTGGKAFVTWYDRRAATPCPAPPCPGINNDLTDYFAGSARLDHEGNLVAGTEFMISEVADRWCASGWPCNAPVQPIQSRATVQPQLAGNCSVTTNIRCDFSDCPGPMCQCPTGETCNNAPRGGCPKYGDYNGNACAAGRLFAAWASAMSPPGVPPSNAG